MRCRISKCHAHCCYNIPFEKHELERYESLIVNPVLFTIPMGPADVAFTNEDPNENKCPFLRSDYKCNIYDMRPDVCRKFGEISELPCRFRK